MSLVTSRPKLLPPDEPTVWMALPSALKRNTPPESRAISVFVPGLVTVAPVPRLP